MAFVELSPYAEEARHRFLRASQALWMLCRNLPPGLEALLSLELERVLPIRLNDKKIIARFKLI